MVDVLSEGQMGICDVDAVVIVKCTGAYMLVGEALCKIN